MSYQITVAATGHEAALTFGCEAGETLLDAALRQGLTIPYGCRNGACGACRGKVVSGEFDHGKVSPGGLSDADKAEGITLFCCATPLSDLTIENRQISRTPTIPVKTLPARIEVLEKKAPDVITLGLRLPASEKFEFLAGQYIDILLKDGKRRSYSLANAPQTQDNGGLLELHIRHVPGGLFTEQVFSTMKARDILRFNGPHGGFFLREDSQKPIILLASGTGFAPIKAIVENMMYKDIRRSVKVYWGCRSEADLYLPDLPTEWMQSMPWLTYTPVLSEPSGDWQGRTGFVHQAVMADNPDLSGHQVYACGAPVMIDAARSDFIARCGLPEDEFYADAFTFAAPGA